MTDKTHKASEENLGELHGAVARVLTSKVLEKDYIQVTNAKGELEDSTEQEYVVTASMLSVATKFLKDNAITSDVAVDVDMSRLQEALAKKVKHSRLKSGKDDALTLVG